MGRSCANVLWGKGFASKEQAANLPSEELDSWKLPRGRVDRKCREILGGGNLATNTRRKVFKTKPKKIPRGGGGGKEGRIICRIGGGRLGLDPTKGRGTKVIPGH